jgi:hypothetical protein
MKLEATRSLSRRETRSDALVSMAGTVQKAVCSGSLRLVARNESNTASLATTRIHILDLYHISPIAQLDSLKASPISKPHIARASRTCIKQLRAAHRRHHGRSK